MTFEVFIVYLELVVEELLKLWVGVPTYDMTKDVGCRTLQLQAMLLWMIYDFLGYSMARGFSHQGYDACP